jgi:hypothetical protein
VRQEVLAAQVPTCLAVFQQPIISNPPETCLLSATLTKRLSWKLLDGKYLLSLEYFVPWGWFSHCKDQINDKDKLLL